MARVLVVEDEPGIALGLEDSLRLEGYQVEVINNGTSASRRALEEPFDLVLLDVMLPGKNGFEVCRDLRRSGFEIEPETSNLGMMTRRQAITSRHSELSISWRNNSLFRRPL